MLITLTAGIIHLDAKFLNQGYRYHKRRPAFQNFMKDTLNIC